MTMEEHVAKRPLSLTLERALEFLPEHKINEEWQRKEDAGELPDGPRGMIGMLDVVWPDITPNTEEARWILGLLAYGSWRWLASIVLYGDSNQMFASHLIEASAKALGLGFQEAINRFSDNPCPSLPTPPAATSSANPAAGQ